jgi:hypothetical protein
MARTPTPSSVTLARANGQAKIDSMKEKSAAIRAQLGLSGKQVFKLKPLSDSVKAKIANSKYGKK